MPRLLNICQLENSSYHDSYDDRIPRFLNICELVHSYDDESDYESDKYDNVKNNEDWSDKGLDYAEYLSGEDNYDKNLLTDDVMSYIIGGYKSYDSSIEG